MHLAGYPDKTLLNGSLMLWKDKSSVVEWGILAVLLLIGSVFLLKNLGNHYLWQDEAQTALIGKTILKGGLPRGYDGKNFLSQEGGREFGENFLWKWHTWLPFYVVAGSFQALGIGTFTARLPFALFGLGSIFLTWRLARDLWQNRDAALTAAAILAFSIPFLLLCRQCRYYSMSAFFTLWSAVLYLRILESKHWNYPFLFLLSMSGLFHTHYLYFATFLAAAGLHCVLFHRRAFLRIAIVFAVTVGVNLPWILWFSTIRYYRSGLHQMFTWPVVLAYARIFLRDIPRFIVPPFALLLIPTACLLRRWKKEPILPRERRYWSSVFLFSALIVCNLAALILTCPLPFFRYQAPLIPLFLILLAKLIHTLSRIHRGYSILVTGMVLLWGPLSDFWYELRHDYDGPAEGICQYLNRHASPNDIILINHSDMPLKFYTPFRIYGGLTGEPLDLGIKPDWLICRNQEGYTPNVQDHYVRLAPILNREYERIEIDYPEIPFENRENMDEHRFRTVKDAPRVVLYRRIKTFSRFHGM